MAVPLAQRKYYKVKMTTSVTFRELADMSEPKSLTQLLAV